MNVVDSCGWLEYFANRPIGCAEETKRMVCSLADALPYVSASYSSGGLVDALPCVSASYSSVRINSHLQFILLD